MKTVKSIKTFLFNVLVWCAGSNPDILKNNAEFSDVFTCGRSEHIKHAWTGALVLIPPALGFCGMLYAASTLDVSRIGVIIIAIVYAVVIFVIERFIVATFRKSDSVFNDLLSMTFVVRLIFSIGLGFTISDPLIQGIFKETIEQKLNDMRLSSIDSVHLSYKKLINEQITKITTAYTMAIIITPFLDTSSSLINVSSSTVVALVISLP